MTFQEAQARFTEIIRGIGRIGGRPTSAHLLKTQKDLQTLLDTCPNTPEFDPLTQEIAELSPRLAGELTDLVLQDLKAREAMLTEAQALLERTANRAAADAKTLTFEKPKLVLAALTESVGTLQELRTAAKAGDFTAVRPKVEALLILLEQVRATATAAGPGAPSLTGGGGIGGRIG